MTDCHTSPHPRQLRIGGKASDPHLPAGTLSGMKCCSPATNQTINLTGAQQIPLWREKKKKKSPWRMHKPAHCPIQLIASWFSQCGIKFQRSLFILNSSMLLCTQKYFQSVSGHQTLMGFLELWVLYPLFSRHFVTLSRCSASSVQVAAPHFRQTCCSLTVRYSARRDKTQQTCKYQAWARTYFLPFLMAACSSFCRLLAWFCLHLCL